jgi:DNA polymerase III gamma/tau subunit
LSRVQRHNIQLVPLSKIVARLREITQAEGVSASDGALSLVARQAQGSMRDALSLLDQLFSAHDPAAGEIGDAEAAETLGALDTSVVSETVRAVLARDAGGALQGVVKAYEQGADMKRLAEELAAHARNLVLASLPGVKQDLPDHELRALATEAKEHDAAQLARVFELLQLAQDEVAKAASPRHALEVALLRAVHLAPSGSLPDLVARVEALSKGQPAPAVGKPVEQRKAPAGWTARVLAPESAPLRAESPRPGSESEAKAIRPEPAVTPPPDPEEPQQEEPPRVESAPLDLRSRFRHLIEAVRAARKPGAASALEHASPQKIDRTGVRIAYRKGDGRALILADKEVRAAVEAAFEKVLGFKAPLIISEEEAAPGESVAELKQKQRAAASSSRIALAKEHPAVRAAVEVLGGEIEDVRDLGEE